MSWWSVLNTYASAILPPSSAPRATVEATEPLAQATRSDVPPRQPQEALEGDEIKAEATHGGNGGEPGSSYRSPNQEVLQLNVDGLDASNGLDTELHHSSSTAPVDLLDRLEQSEEIPRISVSLPQFEASQEATNSLGQERAASVINKGVYEFSSKRGSVRSVSQSRSEGGSTETSPVDEVHPADKEETLKDTNRLRLGPPATIARPKSLPDYRKVLGVPEPGANTAASTIGRSVSADSLAKKRPGMLLSPNAVAVRKLAKERSTSGQSASTTADSRLGGISSTEGGSMRFQVGSDTDAGSVLTAPPNAGKGYHYPTVEAPPPIPPQSPTSIEYLGKVPPLLPSVALDSNASIKAASRKSRLLKGWTYRLLPCIPSPLSGKAAFMDS